MAKPVNNAPDLWHLDLPRPSPRRLSIGYGRAARIVDQLFDAGVLGPSDGSKGREVLVSMDELDVICGAG